MFRNLYLKALRDQRKALLGWTAGIIIFIVIEAAIWPSIRDMSAWKDLLAAYPEPMRKLFNLEQFTTGTGFMNAELFSALLPLFFIIFGIGRGARAIAGEEESGTLDVLLVTPLSPGRMLLQQAAALVTGVAVLGAGVYVTLAVSSVLFGLGIGAATLAAATTAMMLLGIEFGFLALAIGAITGRRSLAIGAATTLAVAAYVLYAAGQIVDSVQPWQPLSPFHQALREGPLGGGLSLSFLWMVAAAAAFVLAAIPLFSRRDIAAH
ncbi:ABC transporter permease [Catelliglobosispora koreensis]|uniref:ABC transporter permease n=1 Tax=Catelliglobosispora koreensis TaxID=129052 RepID=UPI000371D0D1|nr:ABC transporter permease subunit [Catelliglobosispora koreensis]